MTESNPDPSSRRGAWRRPVVVGIALLTGAVLVGLTAPTSGHPPQRIGIALVIGGAVLTAFSVRDRRWMLLAAGLTLGGAGTLLVVDGDRFIASVARGGGGVTVIASLPIAVHVARRLGRTAGAAFVAFAAAAAFFFVAFDELLLPLVPGLLGAFGVALAMVGVVRASNSGVLTSSLTLGRTMRLGVEAIVDQATTTTTDEAARDKLLFDGPDRQTRVLRFLILMGFSSAIASLGIVADSTAVVIGAMLVAPLLTPLMGMSMSLVTGRTDALRTTGAIAGAGVVVAVAVGFLVSAIVGRGTDVATNTQIVTRSSPTLLDLFIAITAGAAGAFAIARRDVADALPGVAVAIALVPPLAVVGVAGQLGATDESVGALVLFGTNAIAILVTGAVTFFLTGAAITDSERGWRLDWWTIAFVGVAIVVLGALVANTTATDELGIRTEIAERVVDDWVGTREYEVQSVDVDVDTVDIVVAGPEMPDDVDALSESLHRALRDEFAVNLKVSVTEQLTIEPDADE